MYIVRQTYFINDIYYYAINPLTICSHINGTLCIPLGFYAKPPSVYRTSFRMEYFFYIHSKMTIGFNLHRLGWRVKYVKALQRAGDQSVHTGMHAFFVGQIPFQAYYIGMNRTKDEQSDANKRCV